MLAKSKLNSIETLMSQALIDLESSHEEFKTIVNKKEKYDQMKESIRNKKDKENFSENEQFNFFSFVLCNMVVITVEDYKNAKVHTLTVKNKKLFWVKMMDVQRGLGIKIIHDLARKEICGIFETKKITEEQKRKYIRTERGISKILTDDSKFKYARSDLIEKKIKNCRGVKL